MVSNQHLYELGINQNIEIMLGLSNQGNLIQGIGYIGDERAEKAHRLPSNSGLWKGKERRYLQQRPVYWKLDPLREGLRTVT